MSKFREPPTSDPNTKGDATVVPFPMSGPGAGPMSSAAALERRKAELKRLDDELDVFSSLAIKEMQLRGRYRDLLETLDLVERMDPVPDDWRAKLEGRDLLNPAAFGDDGKDIPDEDQDEGDEEDDDDL